MRMRLGLRMAGGATPSGDDLSDLGLSYSGNDTDLTVPAGVSTINFALGGGGSGGSQTSFGTTAVGGPGGFVLGVMSVSEGDRLKVQVGGTGGPTDASTAGTGGWPDGGDGQHPAGDVSGGGGGGSTRIWKSTDGGSTWALQAIAGGGGAPAYSTGGHGGAGGGLTGDNASTGNGGTGGSQVAGGVDANDPTDVAKTGVQVSTSDPTPAKTGGDGGDGTAEDDGGGAGGGYFGGGGGGGDGFAGGGGSSWGDTDLIAFATYKGLASVAGSVPPSAMTSHAKYPGGNASVGGRRGAVTGVDGNPGWAHIWTDDTLADQVDAIYAATTSTRLKALDFGTWTAPSVPATPPVTTKNGLDAIFFEAGSLDRLESGVTPGDYTDAVVYVVFAAIDAGEEGFVMTDDASTKYLGRLLNGNTTPPLSSNVGTPAPTEYANFMAVTTRDALHDGLTTDSAPENSAPSVYSAAGVDFATWTQIFVGGNGGGPSAYLRCWIHEAGIIQNPSAAQVALLDAYYGSFIA